MAELTLVNVASKATADAHYANTSNPHSVTKSQVGLGNVDNTSDANKPISTAAQAALDDKADLVGGKVPSSQLPAYVDDVETYTNLAAFPVTGESGKIYIAEDTNLTYRWSGSAYVEISASLALGETSSTAYRGDRGKTAYDHSQTTGNPHSTAVGDITGAVGTTQTQTLTNKRITPRVLSAASYTTDTGTSLNCDNLDGFFVTAQAGALLFNNPTGTPEDGQVLLIRIKDSGTARALTYGSQFRGIGSALPSTTVISKTLYLCAVWNAADSKWDTTNSQET